VNQPDKGAVLAADATSITGLRTAIRGADRLASNAAEPADRPVSSTISYADRFAGGTAAPADRLTIVAKT
jgi:hypothetical protein